MKHGVGRAADNAVTVRVAYGGHQRLIAERDRFAGADRSREALFWSLALQEALLAGENLKADLMFADRHLSYLTDRAQILRSPELS